MAISFANLGASSGTTEQAPDIREIVDATSYTIPSWDPPNDGIVVLCILNGENAGNIDIASVTGNGDFWTLVHAQQYPATPVTRNMSIYAAYGADLTTAATVIDYGGATQLNCYVSIFHILGADESGAVNASPWVMSNLVSGDALAASTTLDFGTASAEANRGIAFVAHNANEVISGDGVWTKMDDMNGAGPAVGMITSVDESGLRDPFFSWTSSVAFGFIGLEVKASGVVAEPTYMHAGLGIVG